MKGYIKRLLREGSYDKPIKYGKDIIDIIRDINPSIDKELDSSIFLKSDKIYCKGGAARLALLIFCDIDNNGGSHSSDVIRDSDFVYIGGYDIDVDGTDVEFSESYEEYFSSRDITLNEVLLSPTELIFTRRAYRDAKREVVNPVSNYYGDDKVIYGRLLARMFLFASRYGYEPVSNLKYEYDENDSHVNFETLVCLLKAYELGIEHKYFRMFREYCENFNFNDFGDWLGSLITSVDFDFYGREDLLINDLTNINDSEIESYLNNSFYKKYPELKKKVNGLQLDDNDFNNYLTKPNRSKQNSKMRRSVNMSLVESIKRLLRENLLIEELDFKLLSPKIYGQDEMVKLGGNYHLSHGMLMMIRLDDIDGLDPIPGGWNDDDGNYNDFIIGAKLSDKPIEVIYDNDNNVFYLYDGNHRVNQAKINGERYIKAFVQADKGTYNKWRGFKG